MAKRQRKEQNPRPGSGPAGKAEVGYMASENYKARLTKGLLGVELGEG